MLVPLLLVAVVILVAAALLWARHARRHAAAVTAAAGRRWSAGLELAAARADFEATSAKLAAVIAVSEGGLVRTGGFGDAHVRRARLRAALATTPTGEEGPQL